MVEIIAEVGVNHCGDEGIALDLIDVAAGCGADTVKFQMFSPDVLVSQARPTDREALRDLMLPASIYPKLITHCAERGVGFLCTPFDVAKATTLRDLGVLRYKIASGCITDGPLLRLVAEYVTQDGGQVLLSTGMAKPSDIDTALAILAHGGLGLPLADLQTPAMWLTLGKLLRSQQATSWLRDHVVLMHCVSEYPTPPEHANVRALLHMRDLFRDRCAGFGYSYHGGRHGYEACSLAVAAGADVIEAHITFDGGDDHRSPDHDSSLFPNDFRLMVQGVRLAAHICGRTLKTPTEAELHLKDTARKALTASRQIKKGEPFAPDNVVVCRPKLDGISPMLWWRYVQMTASHDYEPGDLL